MLIKNNNKIMNKSIVQQFIPAKLITSALILSLVGGLYLTTSLARAESTGVTTSPSILTATVGVKVNFAADVQFTSSTTAGTNIVVSDDSGTGSFFNSTIEGLCNDPALDADNRFAIDQNKGVCYSNSVAGDYIITVALRDATDNLIGSDTIAVRVEIPVPPVCTPQTDVAGSTNIQNASTSEFFNSVNDALADCDTTDGDTIVLLGNISTTEQITISRPMTLDGNDFTISPTFTKTSNSNNTVITIVSDDVTIMDVMINGTNGTNLHGIQVYLATEVLLDGVTVTNSDYSGIVVNGSTVTARDITTGGNAWHAINVDQGSGVEQASVLNIQNTSVHGELSPMPPHIFVDNVAKNVSVNDVNAQYDYSTTTFRGNVAGIYTLKTPVTPDPVFNVLTTTVVVSGNTASGENQPGWMFSRDAANATAIEFSSTTASIGAGSLYVLPISSTTAARKFIGEYFALTPIADIESFAYDFKMGTTSEAGDANQFYLNVYANFGQSDDTKFYDCKYDVVPTVGSVSGFTTVTFDPTVAYPVTTRGGATPSPYVCPSIPASMDSLSGSSTVRAFALNLGDTSLSDADLDGFFDKIVFKTENSVALQRNTTTFDFDPVAPAVVVPEDEEVIDDNDNNGGSRSGGTRGGSRSRSGNAPSGQVLGAATSDAPRCFDNGGPGIYLYDYMRLGSNTSVWEIMKLQFFLTAQGFYTPNTGVFDLTTDAHVRLFQEKYSTRILTPWVVAGLMEEEEATGYVYLTTRATINNIVCPGSVVVPAVR